MITKEFFVSCIEAIEKESQYLDKFDKVMRDLLDDGCGWPKVYQCRDKLIEWLQIEMNDTGSASWIEWYLFELSFGKEAHRLKAYIGISEYIIDTPEKLYDFIMLQSKAQ
jgi:hypothetical protein